MGSEIFRECQFQGDGLMEPACPGGKGGNVSGDALCGPGYTGPRCAICEEGYVITQTLSCMECNAENKLIGLLIMVGIPVLAIMAVSALYLIYKKVKPCLDADGASTINPDTGAPFTNADLIAMGIARVKEFVSKKRDFIKVILNYMQSASQR